MVQPVAITNGGVSTKTLNMPSASIPKSITNQCKHLCKIDPRKRAAKIKENHEKGANKGANNEQQSMNKNNATNINC